MNSYLAMPDYWDNNGFEMSLNYLVKLF